MVIYLFIFLFIYLCNNNSILKSIDPDQTDPRSTLFAIIITVKC